MEADRTMTLNAVLSGMQVKATDLTTKEGADASTDNEEEDEK